jgi:hypothetical protein
MGTCTEDVLGGNMSNIAIIKNGKVVNVTSMELDVAKEWLMQGTFGDADSVEELPDRHGIGDSCDGANWTKAEPIYVDEPPAEPPVVIDPYIEIVSRLVEEAVARKMESINEMIDQKTAEIIDEKTADLRDAVESMSRDVADIKTTEQARQRV